jgi:hypothetical protein
MNMLISKYQISNDVKEETNAKAFFSLKLFIDTDYSSLLEILVRTKELDDPVKKENSKK